MTDAVVNPNGNGPSDASCDINDEQTTGEDPFVQQRRRRKQSRGCRKRRYGSQLILVADANAAMKMDTASSAVTLPFAKRVMPAVPAAAGPMVAESVADPAAMQQQQQQQQALSRNVDSNEIFDLKLQLAVLKNENGNLKVEVSDGKFNGTSLFHSLSLKLACLFIFIFH